MFLSSAFHQMIILSFLLLIQSAFTSGGLKPLPTKDVLPPLPTDDSFTYDPKEDVCCKTLTMNEPLVQIKRCHILPGTEDCLECVLFIDIYNRMHCIDPNAPWLSARIKRLKENGVNCV